MNYKQCKEEAYELLTDYTKADIDQFNLLEEDRLNAKKELNMILGLNEENNYRAFLNKPLTESQFRITFPRTVEFINLIVGDVRYTITSNRVYTGERTYKKLSKVINKFLNEDGNISNNYSLFTNSSNELGIHNSKDSYISGLIDMCKPKNIVVSTNIYDMLTSSTNTSYHSCYNMDGGEYFNGNLSYIRDSFTVITFVYADDITRKVGRSWAYIFPDKFKLLMPGKAYGSMYKPEYKLIRKFIESAISKHKGVRPYWKFLPNIDFDSDYYSNGRGAVYVDTEPMGMAYHKRQVNDDIPHITFEPARCLVCGSDTYHAEAGVCYDCHDHNYCECCEENFSGEGYSHPNGGHVCLHCYDEYFFTCEDCGNLEHTDDGTWIESRSKLICSNCYSDNYTRCSNCDEVYYDNDITTVGSENICCHCIVDYPECEECGMNVYIDDFVEYNDRHICIQCREELVENEELETVTS